MFSPRFHSFGLVVSCFLGCTRAEPWVDEQKANIVTEAPMPGPNRGRLENAVRENDACIVCHDEQAAEWRGSMHQRADVDAAYRQAFAIEPLPFCRGCHAPEANPQMDPPRAVSELGVGCVTCHVTEDGAVLAAPATNARLAPHSVRRTANFAVAGGCVNCHEFLFPGLQARPHDDDGFYMQTTIREHARSTAAKKPCADCHMPSVGGKRSHSFAQVRDPEWLRKNLEIKARRTEADTVELTLRQIEPGHGFPTGDLFRRLEVGAELRDEKGNVLRRDVQYLARHFVERPNATGRELRGDDRLFDAPVVLDLDVAPSSKPEKPLRIFYWVKLQRVATVGLGLQLLEAVVESEVELHSGELKWTP